MDRLQSAGEEHLPALFLGHVGVMQNAQARVTNKQVNWLTGWNLERLVALHAAIAR